MFIIGVSLTAFWMFGERRRSESEGERGLHVDGCVVRGRALRRTTNPTLPWRLP